MLSAGAVDPRDSRRLRRARQSLGMLLYSLALLAALCLLLPAPANASTGVGSETVVLSGVFRDLETGAGLANPALTITDEDGSVVYASVGRYDGVFRVELPLVRGRRYDFRYAAQGYQSDRSSIEYKGQTLVVHPVLARADRTRVVASAVGAGSVTAASNSTPPATIRVYRAALGRVDVVDFRYYCKHVLPSEWIAGWHGEALKAGAMAAKEYAWYWVNQGGKWPSLGADVKDNTSDQVYDPNVSYPSTDAAVDATWDYRLLRSGAIFQLQYCSGLVSPCTGLDANHRCLTHPSRMAQWGTQYLARDYGWSWQQIVDHYCGPVEIVSANPPAVALTAPIANSVSTNTWLALRANAANASKVTFSAYYADNPADSSTAAWHAIGEDTNGADGWGIDWDTSTVADQGFSGWGTVNICATAVGGGGTAKSYSRLYLLRRPNLLSNASFERASTTGWRGENAPVTASAVTGTPSSPAREGAYYARVVGSGVGASFCQDVGRGVKPGESYTYSVWLRALDGGPVEGTLALWNLGQGERGSTSFVTSGGGWQPVTVTLNPTKAGSALRAELYLKPGVTYCVDAAQLTQSHLTNSSFELGSATGWAAQNAPGSLVAQRSSAAVPAKDGEWLLAASTSGSGGSMIQDTGIVAQPGETYTLSAWVRSATGSPVNGTFSLWALGGAQERGSTAFSVSGEEWRLVSVPVSVVNAGHTKLRSEIYMVPGQKYLVDGAQLTKSRLVNSSFEYGSTSAWHERGSIGKSIGATGAFEGKHFARVWAAGPDTSLYQDIGIAPRPGESYTFSLWVRSATGAPVNGTLALWALGGAQEQGNTNFTVSGNRWQLVSAPVNVANAGHSSLRAELYLASGASYDIDAASLSNGNPVAADAAAVLSASAPSTCCYAGPITLKGTLRTAGGAALSGRRVAIQYSYDKRSWTTLKTATVTSSGSYAASVAPTRKTYYRARFSGDATCAACSSAVRTVTPRVALSTPKAPRTMRRTRSYTVYGSLKPRHAPGGYPVRIYRWKKIRSGKWRSYGYVKAKAYDSSGYTKYKRKVRLKYKGTWRLRAYAPGDSLHAATWSSGYDYVKVR